MKKALTLLLAFLLLLSSCSSTPAADEPANSGSTSENTSSDTPAPEEIVVEEEISYVETLEQKDFEGYCYRMLAHSFDERPFFGMSDAFTGEVLQDAIYQRKLNTMERLNITIKEIDYPDRNLLIDDASKTIQAGDNAYDFICTALSAGINTLAMSGYLLDLTTVPYLTLDSSERWNASMAKDMRIDGKQFFTAGVTSVSYLLSPQLVLFNQEIAAENSLPSLYELAFNRQWTIDKMNELMQGVAIDLNGDGIMDPHHDRYAMEVEGTFGAALYTSAGLVCAYPDEDGNWEMHLDDPAAIDLIDKCAAILHKPNDIYCDVHSVDQPLFEEIFNTGRSLFLTSTVWHAVRFRASDCDFGVLPIPLINEGDEYRNGQNTYLPTGIGLPITAQQLDRIGLIMETMAAYSSDLITPAVCEKTLGKTARDAESYQMLEMIFPLSVYDLNTIMNINNTSSMLREAMLGELENYTSEYKRISKNTNKLLNKFIKACRSQGEE